MHASRIEARLEKLDPRLEKIYRDAKAVTEETAAALDDDFQLSAMIVQTFLSYLARTERAADQEIQKARTWPRFS